MDIIQLLSFFITFLAFILEEEDLLPEEFIVVIIIAVMVFSFIFWVLDYSRKKTNNRFSDYIIQAQYEEYLIKEPERKARIKEMPVTGKSTA